MIEYTFIARKKMKLKVKQNQLRRAYANRVRWQVSCGVPWIGQYDRKGRKVVGHLVCGVSKRRIGPIVENKLVRVFAPNAMEKINER